MMTALALRHYCRNPRCRMKLETPVENRHRAFCCHGCAENFYRSKCRVCERDITVDPMTGARRSSSQGRKFCGRRCKAEAAKYPLIFAWELPTPTKPSARSRSAHSTGLKTRLASDRPAPIHGPASIIAIEVYPRGCWRTVASADGVIAKVHSRRGAT
jgi:hypothetical protein